MKSEDFNPFCLSNYKIVLTKYTLVDINFAFTSILHKVFLNECIIIHQSLKIENLHENIFQHQLIQ